MSTAADLANMPVLPSMKAEWAKHEATTSYDGFTPEQKTARLAMRSKAVQEVLALLSLTGTSRVARAYRSLRGQVE